VVTGQFVCSLQFLEHRLTKEVIYDYGELDEMVSAYALSVHKP